jgi:2'-5' RNA ligase
MPKPGDHIIVHMVDDVPEGFRFARKRLAWPLHITLLRWFEVPEIEPYEARLEAVAATTPPFTALVGHEIAFGENGEVPVNVIADMTALQGLHKRLLESLKESDGALESVRWSGEAYRPHITHHGDHRRQAGDDEPVDDFTLVRIEDDHMCQVVRHFALSGQAAGEGTSETAA